MSDLAQTHSPAATLRGEDQLYDEKSEKSVLAGAVNLGVASDEPVLTWDSGWRAWSVVFAVRRNIPFSVTHSDKSEISSVIVLCSQASVS